ncbi:hypothetical protein E4T56_gene12725 [Termitomyces sp. T112]|nr:hypothetical protein E4T56_gene12725 [Termitomyces sp. T112]
MASGPSANSLHLDMEIETTDTQQNHGVIAFLDSGAMGLLLDLEFVKCCSLTMQPLSKPIPVYNIDKMPNKASTISSVVALVLHYWNYMEHAIFTVTSLGRQDMILGLTNSLATFQTMINDIFQDLIAEGIVCMYLDNILIYTKMLEEHCQITHLVLKHLHQHQLYLKLEKCEFEQTCIESLGLTISHGTVEIDPVKVAGVAEWPEPQNKEVQAFLVLANFYQRFIQDFLHHACPLFDLMRKDVTWSWGPLEQMAFDTLKCAVTSRPILLFPDDNSPFHVEADSSDFATGAVLSQQSLEDEKWHPVAFYSKSLNAVELNYKIHNKEMLAIIWLFKEWWHFLEGVWHKFEVWTDYKNLEYFQMAKKLNCQQPGQSMGKLDALSQRVDHGTGKGDNSNIVLLHPKLFAIQAMESLAISGAEVNILQDIWQGNWDGQQEELVVQATRTLKSGHTTGVKVVCTNEWAL